MLLIREALLLSLTTCALGLSTHRADADGVKSSETERSVAGTDDWPSGTQTGDVTFGAFGLGACGVTNTDADYVVAISYLIFDNYPGYNGDPTSNPVCFQQLSISYEGKSVTVMVTDSCTACSFSDLDVTPAAFEQLADLSLGRLHDATWSWV